ncbi:MAG: transposase [Candidatus Parabeggiatoa sp. nov. 2]|nr:MAG: transposase [Gammaproteobacteria bacterium]
MLTLEEIIKNSKDSRETKRAIAVKVSLFGIKHKEIADIVTVSEAFVSKWRGIYETEGPEALLLKHKGSQGYLSSSEIDAVIAFLKTKTHYTIEELLDHLENNYEVVYKSKQSYYDLFEMAKLSWKKTEKVNPKKDEDLVKPILRTVLRKDSSIVT